jgi:uncharacterized protein YbjQ (UPF0145 family)
MAMIEATCGDCGTTYSVDESHAGKTAKCRKCGGAVAITGTVKVRQAPPGPTNACQISRDDVDESGGLFGTKIATTDTLQGWTITGYHGLVTTHVVAGTGFFSDFAAGMTDFFGGRSATYQRQMAAIEEEAFAALCQEAAARGANWVVGARIDFDEISGKGMQMFMVSAQGTAVRAVAAPVPVAQSTHAGLVSGSLVRDAIKRQQALDLVSRIESGQEQVSEDALATLGDTRVSESVPLLLLAALSETATDKARTIATQGLRVAPRDTVRRALQDALLREPRLRVANELYRDLGLLDLNWVLQQMRADDRQARFTGLRMLCQCVASAYTRHDIEPLKAILEVIPAAFPETCTFHEHKGMLGGSPMPRWRCEKGHDNVPHWDRCKTCEIDRHGVPLWAGTPEGGTRIASATLSLLEQQFGE